MILVEAMFPDGVKLISVHQPIRPGQEEGRQDPARRRYRYGPNKDVELNAGRRTATVHVTNTGDRPVQVGSHFHFFETNRAARV